jgi:SPP1 family phage portal protein
LDINEIIIDMINDYHGHSDIFDKMQRYYDGKHDILSTYVHEPSRANNIEVVNYIHKFIEEEISYCFGNGLTYISKSSNEQEINDINYQLSHWNKNHNQELMRQLEIYGLAFELYYINERGEFSSRILNPSNAIVYCDSDNVPQIFIHFYRQKYDSSEYYDIYFPDRIEIYQDGNLIDTKENIFSGVPVSVCFLGKEKTIYSKIKSLNDSLNQIMSDMVNVISDYRLAYLVVTGADVDESTAELLKTKGILNLKGKGEVSWLMKEMNSDYVQNMITEIKKDIYEACDHIDSNEKLQSNTSGIALRTRLVFLEQRCKTVFDAICNTITDRMRFLFQYLNLKNLPYDYKDIKVTFNPCIPQDIQTIAQTINQLGDKISTQTALAQIPWVENPAEEMEKIRKEQEDQQSIDLDKVGLTNG